MNVVVAILLIVAVVLSVPPTPPNQGVYV